MKKNSQRILPFLLSGIMVFASTTSVMASSLNVRTVLLFTLSLISDNLLTIRNVSISLSV